MGGGGRQELQEGRRAGGEERGAGGGEREGAVTMIERESGEGRGELLAIHICHSASAHMILLEETH